MGRVCRLCRPQRPDAVPALQAAAGLCFAVPKSRSPSPRWTAARTSCTSPARPPCSTWMALCQGEPAGCSSSARASQEQLLNKDQLSQFEILSGFGTSRGGSRLGGPWQRRAGSEVAVAVLSCCAVTSVSTPWACWTQSTVAASSTLSGCSTQR